MFSFLSFGLALPTAASLTRSKTRTGSASINLTGSASMNITFDDYPPPLSRIYVHYYNIRCCTIYNHKVNKLGLSSAKLHLVKPQLNILFL